MAERVNGCTIIARPAETSEVGDFIRREISSLKTRISKQEHELRFQKLADQFDGEPSRV